MSKAPAVRSSIVQTKTQKATLLMTAGKKFFIYQTNYSSRDPFVERAEKAAEKSETAYAGALNAEHRAKKSKAEADAARVAALGHANTSRTEADKSDAARALSETAKTGSESARDAANLAKTAAETAKTGAEAARDTATAEAVKADAARVKSETASGSATAAQTAAEAAKLAAEKARDEANSSKGGSDAAKAAAEAAKAASETARDQANTAKSGADTAKAGADAAKALAETAKAGSETAKAGADSAKVAAEAARDAANTAKTGAETAKAGADSAKVGADAAKTASEAARDLSEHWANEAKKNAESGGELTSTGNLILNPNFDHHFLSGFGKQQGFAKADQSGFYKHEKELWMYPAVFLQSDLRRLTTVNERYGSHRYLTFQWWHGNHRYARFGIDHKKLIECVETGVGFINWSVTVNSWLPDQMVNGRCGIIIGYKLDTKIKVFGGLTSQTYPVSDIIDASPKSIKKTFFRAIPVSVFKDHPLWESIKNNPKTICELVFCGNGSGGSDYLQDNTMGDLFCNYTKDNPSEIGATSPAHIIRASSGFEHNPNIKALEKWAFFVHIDMNQLWNSWNSGGAVIVDGAVLACEFTQDQNIQVGVVQFYSKAKDVHYYELIKIVNHNGKDYLAIPETLFHNIKNNGIPVSGSLCNAGAHPDVETMHGSWYSH